MSTISREAAIEALWKALYEYEDKTEKQFIESDELDFEDWVQHRIFVQSMNDADRQTILDLPSAQPERKVGKWIKNESTYGWHCSACEKDDLYAFVEDSDTGANELQDHFCPNCGARMEGEEA